MDGSDSLHAPPEPHRQVLTPEQALPEINLPSEHLPSGVSPWIARQIQPQTLPEFMEQRPLPM
jgi:hypothetical protein